MSKITYTVDVDENGNKFWYFDGELHREDGPAIEYANGTKSWYLDGERVTEEEHKRRTSKSKGGGVMKEPTMKEVLELVEFDRNADGTLHIKKVCGDVCGSVIGNVKGDVWANVHGGVAGDVFGTVRGKISGRAWQFVETPKEKAIRLIREGKGDEAIKVLEGE